MQLMPLKQSGNKSLWGLVYTSRRRPMVIRCGCFWAKTRRSLRVGWLITAGLFALYMGLIRPQEQNPGIAQMKASGLAAVEKAQQHYVMEAKLTALGSGTGRGEEEQDSSDADRKLLRTASLKMVVKSPAESYEKIT